MTRDAFCIAFRLYFKDITALESMMYRRPQTDCHRVRPARERTGRAARLVFALLLLLSPRGARPADPPPDDLVTAHAAMADGLHDLAERHLVRFLAANQERPRDCVPALIWLCQALTAQGRPADVLAVLDANAAIVAAGREEGGFDFWRVRSLLDLGRSEPAMAHVQGLALEGLSRDYATGLRRLLARAQLAAGDRAGARATFEAIDAQAATAAIRAENLLEWAHAELAAGDADACEALLRRQSQLAATNLPLPAVALGRLLQAQLLLRRGPESQAEPILQALADDAAAPADSRAEAWVELAAIRARQGLTNAVLNAGYQALERVRPSPLQAWRLGLRYGRILVSLPGQLGAGASLIKTRIREHPGALESAVAQRFLAEAWLAAGSNTQAAAEYRNYLETYGEAEHLASALRGQALALFRLERFAEAATRFQKAAQTTGDPAMQAECLLKAADAHHANRHYEEAATCYARVADLAVTNAPHLTAPAAFMAADALERLGRVEAAGQAYGRLAEGGLAAIADEALLRLAQLAERQEDLAGALRHYSRVIDRAAEPSVRGQALLGRGRTHYRNYQFEAAIRDLSRVEETGAAGADEAAYLRMLALYGTGADAEAARLCDDFFQRHAQSPLLPEAALWRAQYAYNQKAFEEAETRFAAFVDQWPAHAWGDAALVWAARAAMRRSEFLAAITRLSRLPREYPASPRLAEARYLQADALCELARFEEAILVFDEIIIRYPESEFVTAAWMRKGDSLFSLGSSTANRYDEALKVYTVVATRPDVTADLALQAAFKRGRCLEKMNRPNEALEQYYDEVVVRYLRDRQSGLQPGAQAQAWFARGAMQAATLLEAAGKPEAAIRVLQRLIQSGVPGAAEAQVLVDRMQGELRWRWPADGRPSGEDRKP